MEGCCCVVSDDLVSLAVFRRRRAAALGDLSIAGAPDCAAMKARFDERLAERTRIARDLHDTFLQTIQGSKLVADDALSAATDLPHMRQAMEKLSAWLGRATEEGRAVLNSLRTSTTEVNDLADAFRRALEECQIHSSMEVSLQVSGQIQEMHPIVRDEIYRIGYEAIRNACVHSQATQLRVELSYGQDLSLRICDNGAGIDPDIVHRGKPGHFGLQSMRERAARIMGKFSVESSAGSGTVITLTVPGGIIYRTVNIAAPAGPRLSSVHSRSSSGSLVRRFAILLTDAAQLFDLIVKSREAQWLAMVRFLT